MEYYFDVPNNAKKFPGRRRNTLPVVIDEDIKEAKQRDMAAAPQWLDLINDENNEERKAELIEEARCSILPQNISKFENFEDLIALRSHAGDRDEWKRIADLICKTQAEGDE